MFQILQTFMINIKNGPKNLKNVSPENLGKNKELPAVGKSQRSL